MNVLTVTLNVVLSLVVPFTLIVTGFYLKNHIKVEIGSNGISVPAAKKSLEKWLYAQIIGYCITVKFGFVSLILSVFADILILIFGSNTDIAAFVGNGIGFAFVFAALIVVEKRVSDFPLNIDVTDNNMLTDLWIKIVYKLIEAREYEKLERFVNESHYNRDSLSMYMDD
ncbi:hypothetical protein HNQ56_002815 [Anaerotaenia torta]|uniref:hypothetical protein n=1 Tax=Anaerotaenia torta TaxID=433293 RepID=UPI003D236EBE